MTKIPSLDADGKYREKNLPTFLAKTAIQAIATAASNASSAASSAATAASDALTAASAAVSAVGAKYTLPNGGMPSTHMAPAVQAALQNAATAVTTESAATTVTLARASIQFESRSPAPLITMADTGMAASSKGLLAPSCILVEGYIPNPLGRYYVYFSSDHDVSDTGGGIWMAYANSMEGPWTVYKPGGTAGPMYVDTFAGFSTETPNVVWDPETQQVFMYYQQAGVNRNQGTVLAVSKDGINFERIGLVLDLPDILFPGNGHTGYAKVIRYAEGHWVAHHLAGGSDWSHTAMSYSTDGVRWHTDPTAKSGSRDQVTASALRAMPQAPEFRLNGESWSLSTMKAYSSGGDPGAPRLVIGPLTPDGTQWMRPPTTAWRPRYAWETDGSGSIFQDIDGTTWLMITSQGSSGGFGVARGRVLPSGLVR